MLYRFYLSKIEENSIKKPDSHLGTQYRNIEEHYTFGNFTMIRLILVGFVTHLVLCMYFTLTTV